MIFQNIHPSKWQAGDRKARPFKKSIDHPSRSCMWDSLRIPDGAGNDVETARIGLRKIVEKFY
jgi:hypothetical protein